MSSNHGNRRYSPLWMALASIIGFGCTPAVGPPSQLPDANSVRAIKITLNETSPFILTERDKISRVLASLSGLQEVECTAKWVVYGKLHVEREYHNVDSQKPEEVKDVVVGLFLENGQQVKNVVKIDATYYELLRPDEFVSLLKLFAKTH